MSFFCSRITTSTNPRDVLPSIAFHLTSYSRPFAQSLFDALEEYDNANIEQKELAKQFDALILRPTKEASLMSGIPKRCVVVSNGDVCESTLLGHSDYVSSVCFSRDGKRIISGSWDNTVRIWNVETGEEANKLEGHFRISVIGGHFS